MNENAIEIHKKINSQCLSIYYFVFVKIDFVPYLSVLPSANWLCSLFPDRLTMYFIYLIDNPFSRTSSSDMHLCKYVLSVSIRTPKYKCISSLTGFILVSSIVCLCVALCICCSDHIWKPDVLSNCVAHIRGVDKPSIKPLSTDMWARTQEMHLQGHALWSRLHNRRLFSPYGWKREAAYIAHLSLCDRLMRTSDKDLERSLPLFFIIITIFDYIFIYLLSHPQSRPGLTQFICFFCFTKCDC